MRARFAMHTTCRAPSFDRREKTSTLFIASFGSIQRKPSCEKSTSQSAGSSR